MIGRIREHLARGEYITVKALAQGVIINPDSPAEEKSVAALLAIQAAMCLGEGLVACTYASRSLGYAQESGRSDLEGRSLFWLGTAKLGVGDHAEARTFLEQYLAGLLQRWSELDGELTGHAYINLGQILQSQRLYADSLKSFSQALVRFQQKGDTRNQVACRHQIAWLLILDNALDEAKEHLDATSAMEGLPPETLTHQLCHEALWHLHAGNDGQAANLAYEVLIPNRPHTSPAHRAVAAYVAGMVAVRLGHLEDARYFADLALECATASGWAHHVSLVARLNRELHSRTQGTT